VHTLERGSMVLAEIIITKESPWCDRMVKDLVLPEECIFTSVLRADNVIYPKGDTVLESGDKVLVISNLPVLSALARKNRIGGMRNGK
ncbi:MAG TPA: TrkA C-terminal domain-containing protein, partial [Clostridiaceae bacterium]|nr:TrkA C-terminal domain-containing protein [Clostridiaceae bacterium]